MPVGLVFKFISKSRLTARIFLFKYQPKLAACMLFRFFSAKVYEIEALMFPNAVVSNSFQVSFILIYQLVKKKD